MSTTIRIAGKTFPACGIICPQGDPGRSEWNRSVCVYGSDWPEDASLGVFIPCENGLLLNVERLRRRGVGWSCIMYAPVCERPFWVDQEDVEWWVPILVSLVDGDLVHTHRWPADKAVAGWDGADEEWLAEHIVRLSTKPLAMPDGPRVRLVPCDAELVR